MTACLHSFASYMYDRYSRPVSVDGICADNERSLPYLLHNYFHYILYNLSFSACTQFIVLEFWSICLILRKIQITLHYSSIVPHWHATHNQYSISKLIYTVCSTYAGLHGRSVFVADTRKFWTQFFVALWQRPHKGIKAWYQVRNCIGLAHYCFHAPNGKLCSQAVLGSD